MRGPKRLLHVTMLVAALLLAASLAMAFTAATVVPTSNAGVSNQPLAVPQLAPAACAGLALTGTVYATGSTLSNSLSHVLIVGHSTNDNIADSGHSNCIVAGGGQDTVNAQAGSICIANTNSKSSYKGCTKS
jgi:hypothetical protein